MHQRTALIAITLTLAACAGTQPIDVKPDPVPPTECEVIESAPAMTGQLMLMWVKADCAHVGPAALAADAQDSTLFVDETDQLDDARAAGVAQ